MKTIIKHTIIAFILLWPFSCADLNDLTPTNEIPANQSIVDKASATAAVNGIYNALQSEDLYFDGWLALAQFFSDEADMTGTFPTRLEFDNFNVFPANGTMSAVWSDLYEVINIANNVISLVPNLEGPSITAEEKADFVAQAKFARAQTYLHLVSLWQEVPLVLEPTREVGQVLFVPKNKKEEIYAQIIKDLDDAANDLINETGPFVASKQAANAFLARVYLYQGKWTEALAKATAVLGPGYDLNKDPFLKDQIYSLGFTPTDGNVLNFFYGPSSLGGRYEIAPSKEIIDAFEPGDTRFSMTLDTISASVPFGLKYPSFSAGISGTGTDPIFFIRHAEMVLIIAEAAAEKGDFETANQYFNQVRQRAGLAPKTLNAANFVDLILHERFVEFAFEGSFRLIDLRRKGKALEILGPKGYKACDGVWPIPQLDMDRNPKLVQNGCCNC